MGPAKSSDGVREAGLRELEFVLERERAFHDAEAAEMDAAAMPPHPVGRFDQRFEWAILDALGSVKGHDVLDLGCGTGDLSFWLAEAGARVTGVDLSPGLVDVARERFARFAPDAGATFTAAPVESTGLADASFDAIAGKWILHHLDLSLALPEIARLLRPGGRAVFVETSALNPALAIARRRLVGRAGVTRYGTPDERPMSREDLRLVGEYFPGRQVDFPNVVLFELLDRHLIGWRWPRLSRALRRADYAVESRLPRLGRWSYYLRLKVERGHYT